MGIKATAYFAASVDGFIAAHDGSIDWLNEANSKVPEGEDCGYGDFMASVDTLVMGRNTYEQVLGFGQWPYGSTPVVVLSSQPISFPTQIPDKVSHSSETPPELCQRLNDQGIEHIYVDGGATIRGFLAHDLIDEITVTIVPVVLGEGISPFGKRNGNLVLKQLRAKVYDFGFVQISYSVQKTS